MDCFEVNAVNYGAPQLRERAIFIGNRLNAVVEFPEPTHGPPAGLTSGSAQPKLFGRVAAPRPPWSTLGDALRDLKDPAPVRLEFSPRKLKYLAMVPPGSNWRSLPVELQKESMGSAWHAKGGRSGWWRRLSFDLPCPTLVTMPNHASTALCHPNEVRALTLREYARIQEFPDDWEICGSPSEQFRQVGNAVPVRLGAVAGEVVLAELDRLRAANWRPDARKPDAYRLVYVQSHVRTRMWFKDGETFVWDDGGENGDAAYAAPKTARKVTEI
jgi:DNA (cytosine-5)-methyltransferase 1